ncbi:LamG-like jellyroll fold domain-containing protein [Polaribacter septentrionalilitoris]|uniref:LamG-like jellyroll fold domain-containing protein n=1 Tax=Polaribacter septentrionalilitoris TaxID=2494657 RepID=UPI00135AAA67|nr:LamG-like jellyroll fold domain-containing protein [Polaribacter septentrionalilitoris]
MKKITLLLFIFSFIGTVSFSQTTETFEDETNNSTSFTNNGKTFNVTSVGEVYNIFVNGQKEFNTSTGGETTNNCSVCGWNGTSADGKFLDNTINTNGTGNGSNFTIKTSDGSPITVKSLYLFTATHKGASLNHSGTLTINGKNSGSTVFTITKNSGFNTNFGVFNGHNFIDFSSGTDYSNTSINELEFISTGNLDYMSLDAFTWDFGTANTAPVIAGTSSGQTVNDTATIQPFSAITTTDADGDNLSATITLDNNFKGVLTGTGLSGSGPYSITSTTPSDLQVKLRALSFNPTDNRTSASETTTFTVVINDGTDTNTDTTTTVISNAVAPAVTSVSVPTNATYTTGQNLDFTVNFSENVLVSGSPQISITVGSTTRQATYVSGNGSGSLVFRYTLQNGDNDNDGISVGNLALNGGTLRDSGGANANLTLNSVGNTTLVLVDAVAPTVTSVTVPANGTYISGQNLDFTVNFSENITVNTGGGSPYINITIGSSSKIANFSSGSGNSYTFRYQIQNGDLDTDGISVGTVTTNGATFRDAANNNANLTLNNVGNTTFVLVDAVAPNITSVSVPANATYLAGQNLDFTVNFNENITVVTTGGTPQVSLTIGATTRQAAYVSGSGSGSLVFKYTLQINELDTDGIVVGTLSANGGTLKDVAGNNANLTLNSVGSTSSVLVDAVAPTITSVGVPANATYLAGQNLDFTVNFNEDITVVTTGGTPQISLTIGSTSYQASYISGSGSSALTFRYTVQNGNNDSDGIAIGSLSLNGGTFKDAAGNDANLTLNSVASTTSVLVDTPLNNALNFDGANDQVDLGNNLNSTLDNLNTFTVEAWVKPETNTGLGVIVGNYHNGVGNMQFLLRRDNANYTFWVDDSTGFKNVTATGAVNIGTWTHIAGVWDGSQTRIYVNGVLSGTTTGITGASFITTANPIRIGFNNVNENFDGDIDEVRIWSDVRNVTEINNLKSTELNGAEDNLLGYYNFNKGIPNGTNTGETTLLDLSTNNNHGTVSNFDLTGTSSNWVVGTPVETIPVVQSVAVPSNATYISGQNLDFTVNYSEDVTVSEIGGTPQIAITIGANTRQAEFESGSGTSALVFRYTVQPGDEDSDGITIASLSANGGTLQDSNNNNANVKLNSIGTTTSILIDAAAPTLSSTNPTDNATDVLLTQNIELTFSENISKGSGNITIFKTSDDSVVETIDVTSGLVSITTTTATINPTDDFELNTEYYVQIAAGVFTDTALNAYTGISDKTSLSFTSQANQTNTYSGSGNWSTTANWSLGRLPIASDNVAINFGSTVLFDVASATINNLNISSGTLNMVAGNALTLDGDLSQTGTFNIASSASANASLIVKGTSTGNVSYLRYVSTNWHLIGAPVEGQSISALSGQVNTSDTKYAIAPYKNNTTTLLRWNYYTTAAGTNDIANSGNFISGKGYTIQKSSFAGTISFTGTLNTDNAGESIAITDGGDDPTGNRWNLIANPYTAAINGNNTADATNNFLKVNIDAGNLDPSRAGLYLWTGSAPYDIKSLDDGAFYIAPGQAFFVHAPDGGGTSASFTEAMQTHQTGNIFSKGSSSNYPEIILNLTDGKANSLTKVRYIQNKTIGLDVGSDVGTFTGASSNFGIFSHLLQDSQGVDFAIQALPNSNYENMIVPIGINAEAGKEISFSANIANFPSGVKVFLEDRAHNRFFGLDEGSKYKITVNNAQNGIGRFYLHTTSSALSVDKSLTLENINVYKLNNSTLRITGLSQERTEVTIFNILGKKVLNTTFKANKLKDIELPHLSNGIYLVQLKNNSGKLTKKIILE